MKKKRVIVGNVKIVVDEMIDEVLEGPRANEIGAIAIFLGIVRGISDGFKVHELVFEGYEPYTTMRLSEAINELLKDDDVIDVRVIHRIGKLKVGEKIVLVLVASKHREKAFKCVEEIIGRLKKDIPIWKMEVRENGKYWVLGDKKRVKVS